VRAAINVPGSHHARVYEIIRERAAQEGLGQYGTYRSGNYPRSFKAIENALLYQVTQDTAYAQHALRILDEMFTSGEEGTPVIPDLGEFGKRGGSKALTYAFPSMAYGICYDWARDGWTDDQRNRVYERMLEGLDSWEKVFRWELYNMPNSNWVSVCRSSELIMMLSAREEQNRSHRLDTLKFLLKKHFDMAYGKTGYSHEGIAYINYGVPFGLAGWLALQSIGDLSMDETFSRIQFHKLLMYSCSYTPDRMHLMTSVDSHNKIGEGLFSLVFPNMDPEELPYYKSFYDHYLGIKASSGFDDIDRLAAIWSFIYYPEKVQVADPDQSFPVVLSEDQYGAWFFRNRWENEDDILFNVMAKSNQHSKGWQDAETFNIGLIAYGSRFFGGPGKKYEAANYSSLLVDGKARISAKDTGYIEYFHMNDTGASLGINGGSKYLNLGVDYAKRHVLVEFDSDSSAIIAIADDLASDDPHIYRWQLNIGDEVGDGDVTVKRGTEKGLPYFLLLGKNGWVKGWQVQMTTTAYEGDDPLYMETEPTKEALLFTVMITGKGVPPKAKFHQIENNNIISVSAKYLYFSHEMNKIFITDDPPALNP